MTDFNILKHATVVQMEMQVEEYRNFELVARDVDINKYFVTGCDVRKPVGILSHLDLFVIQRQAANEICFDDCAEMKLQFHAECNHGAWLVNPVAYMRLGKLQYADGAYALDAIGEQVKMLGLPVHVYVYSPEIGYTGDVILADLSKYVIGRYSFRRDGESHVFYDGFPVGFAVEVNDTLKHPFVALRGNTRV